jgi:metal-sulfur cluster biosynthetic enzyme
MSRRTDVVAALDEIVDPCSAAAGTPAGLVEMGIVDAVAIDGVDVTVTLLPTFAGCLFAGLFAGEAERRIRALPWCERVRVELVGDRIWTEERMSRALRERRRRRSCATSAAQRGLDVGGGGVPKVV